MNDVYAELSEVRLHYVEQGEGPLVVLLHGFPEAWFGWRFQIPALADAGFRVVAPDLRGFNLSSKPGGVAAYDLARVAFDVQELIRSLGAERARIAGHDWGGATAWQIAMRHPEVVERLAILNSPHPRRFKAALRDPRQLAKSWYFGLFQLPWLPEQLIGRDDWAGLKQGFARDARAGTFTPEDASRYVEAWEQPGARSAMVNYYRASIRHPPPTALVEAPTLVLWGDRDRYLMPALAEPDAADVPNLDRVVHFDASHWIHHDEADEVNRLLAEFFAGGDVAPANVNGGR
jgi:pimeloyl-ACP methyl ester carboxylesterase